MAFACTILPTIHLLLLTISLVQVVLALESLLKYAMNNEGGTLDENVFILSFGAVKTKTHFGPTPPSN
jgi:hypothetical protein